VFAVSTTNMLCDLTGQSLIGVCTFHESYIGHNFTAFNGIRNSNNCLPRQLFHERQLQPQVPGTDIVARNNNYVITSAQNSYQTFLTFYCNIPCKEKSGISVIVFF